ncbi:hypothetical protein L596_016583 [Steinernema carpocapsae]|uniref:RRM domain-containing protein n=1 Tax=Steinernema carpocapsae TaxID=34508 RepID=A0A4U5NJA2_STECR|nr:hypothetical protein L596_016583 [Steinernema carpocapsae]
MAAFPKKKNDWQRDPPSSHARKVFVGGLSEATTEGQVAEYFEYFGKIESVIIVRFPNGASKHFGYVKFADMFSVQRLWDFEQDLILNGRPIEVRSYSLSRAHGRESSDDEILRVKIPSSHKRSQKNAQEVQNQRQQQGGGYSSDQGYQSSVNLGYQQGYYDQEGYGCQNYGYEGYTKSHNDQQGFQRSQEKQNESSISWSTRQAWPQRDFGLNWRQQQALDRKVLKEAAYGTGCDRDEAPESKIVLAPARRRHYQKEASWNAPQGRQTLRASFRCNVDLNPHPRTRSTSTRHSSRSSTSFLPNRRKIRKLQEQMYLAKQQNIQTRFHKLAAAQKIPKPQDVIVDFNGTSTSAASTTAVASAAIDDLLGLHFNRQER